MTPPSAVFTRPSATRCSASSCSRCSGVHATIVPNLRMLRLVVIFDYRQAGAPA